MATRASELIFKPQNRFLKMSLECFHTFKYDFWWLFGCSRVIGNTFPTTYKPWERFGEKKFFRIFSTFLKQFLLHFSLKMKQKWTWKNRKSDFFKNEALNQKSGTVKPLGYVLTVFHDCGDPPRLETGNAPSLWLTPWKALFSTASESFKLKFCWSLEYSCQNTRKNTK